MENVTPQADLHISVRALVAFVLRSGSLEHEFTGSQRTLAAIRAHQKIQQARPADYQSEVSVRHVSQDGRFRLVVSGRIDGVFPAAPPRPAVVEEIKTTTRALEEMIKQPPPMHWGQLQTYAYFYALANGLEHIEAQLTYYQLESGKIRSLRQTYKLETLAGLFDHLLQGYLGWAERLWQWLQCRDQAITALSFPYASYRPGQRQMAVAVYKAMPSADHLLIEAATGIGKTMAVLFPAIKALGEGLIPKIFYLTARTTAQKVAEQMLAELRAAGLRFKALTLTAKEKVCFCNGAACTAEECEFADGYYDRIQAARTDIFEEDAWQRTTLEHYARKHQVCPFEFALEMAQWADGIICDVNYAFDPRVYLRRFFLEEPNTYAFLIDEAHNLVDRARDMFSAELEKQPFLALRRSVRQRLPSLYRRLGRINAWMVKQRRACVADGGSQCQPTVPPRLEPLLREFLRTAERWLTRNEKAEFRPALLELYFQVSTFVRVVEQFDERYVTFYTTAGKNLKVRLFCIDPSQNMAQALERCGPAVFFSATMTPMAYFQRILGCKHQAREMVFGSPFPPQNFAVLVADRISTYYRDREQSRPALTRLLAGLAEGRRGNYLLFFPSYQYMQAVHADFTAAHPLAKTLMQRPGMTEDEREAFLNHFNLANQETLVGFAVMGGIFGEGIDLSGERLSGAAVVGVGLPGICPEREQIRAWFEQLCGAGFEYAYLYPGLVRVLQAGGRVIRTEQDRGVLLLVDGRFGRAGYQALLPKHWQTVRVRSTTDLARHLKAFWRQCW